MSFFPGKDPAAGDRYACDALETVVVPRSVDLARAFRCAARCRMRAGAPSGRSCFSIISARPSSRAATVSTCGRIRISGLSTLTYLYDGEIIHRDNLGVKAAIHPGAVNWMTAGRGIVHSERTAPDHRRDGEPLHGLQFWVGHADAPRRRSIRASRISTATSCRSSTGRARPCGSSPARCSARARRSRPPPRRCSPTCRSMPAAVDAARRRMRGARDLYGGGRDRYVGRHVRRRPAAGVPPDRPHHPDGDAAVAASR